MTNQKKIWYLENFNLFKKLGIEKIKKIDEVSCMTVYKKNDLIYLPNELKDNVFFVKKGKVKISTYNDNGEEFIKTIMAPGEMFGSLPYSPGSEGNDYAYSLKDTVVCYMPASQFHSLVEKDWELNQEVMKFVGIRLRRLERRLEALSFKDARQRLIEMILDFNEQFGKRVGTEYFIEQPLTHKEIAALIASSRQTVTKHLNELRNAGIIDFNRKKIIVRDIDKLRDEQQLNK